MKSSVVTSALLLTLVFASSSAGDAQASQVLRPGQLCSDHGDAAIATFEDADLEAAVRRALSVGAREDLICGLVCGLRGLAASGAGPVRTVTGGPRDFHPPLLHSRASWASRISRG